MQMRKVENECQVPNFFTQVVDGVTDVMIKSRELVFGRKGNELFVDLFAFQDLEGYFGGGGNEILFGLVFSAF